MSLSVPPSQRAPKLTQVSGIVIVAHGPTGTTLTAAGRARALVGQENVVVVAGTEPGLTAIDRAGDRDYTVVADHGPEALGNAIAQLGSHDLIALLHDDMELAADGHAALAMAHNKTGLVAVPSGSTRGRVVEVDTAQLACAVGTPTELARLAAASSFGPGYPATGPFASVPVAAAHESSCRTQMRLPTPNAAPLLVAGMIVRDEAANITAAIASLEGIVDRIEVVDTGSIDDTVSLAKAAGANVTEIAWQDDFAHARNVALDQCRDATFMLWLDADERLVCSDRRRFRSVLHTYDRLYGAYRLEIHNRANGDETTHSFWARRIISTEGTAFEGAIHEQARRLDGQPLIEVQSALCSINHYGYAEEVVDARDKQSRNLELAKSSYEAEPTAERAIHYARTMAGSSADTAAALEVFDSVSHFIDDAPVAVRAMMLSLKARLLLDVDRLDDAIETATKATELVAAEPVGRAVLAQAQLQAGRYHDVLAAEAHLDQQPSPTPVIEDGVAWTMRSRAVFEASLAVGDTAGATGLIGDLPESYNPWPALSSRLDIDQLVGLAPQAAQHGQDNYVSVLVARPDLQRPHLTAAIRSFGDYGRHVPDAVIVEAETRLDLHEQAEELRQNFIDHQGDADAISYAAAVCAGDVGLTLELESCTGHDHAAALAMGLAAEALHRRGRLEEATADAVVSGGLWPGALNAVDILAQSATGSDMADVALDIIEAARATGAVDKATRERRHGLINRAVEANLALGNMAAAASEALILLEQQGHVESWGEMLAVAANDSQYLAVVLGLALLGDGEDFVQAAAASLAPEKAAEVCAAYLVAGGTHPDAVSTGVLAALIGGIPEIAKVAAGYASLLEPDAAIRLAEHVQGAGAQDIADQLTQDVTVGA